MQLTDEYRACAKKFKEHFGYGVPLRMIPQTASTEEVIEKINLCIEKNKDVPIAMLNYLNKNTPEL